MIRGSTEVLIKRIEDTKENLLLPKFAKAREKGQKFIAECANIKSKIWALSEACQRQITHTKQSAVIHGQVERLCLILPNKIHSRSTLLLSRSLFSDDNDKKGCGGEGRERG